MRPEMHRAVEAYMYVMDKREKETEVWDFQVEIGTCR